MVRFARNLTRKSLALLTSLLLVLFWVPGLIAASPAHAAVNTTIPGSPYNGSNGVIDTDASIHNTPDPVGTADTTSFTGGKEDDQCPGVSTQGLSSPKDDLTKVYFGSKTVSSNVYLYLAWIRSTTNGTTTIDFELNQSTGAMTQCNGVNPARTAGDLLFTYDFSNGGGNVDIHFYTWDTSLNQGAGGWKAQGDITSLLDSNNKPIVEASTDNTGIQGEMAVNLTLLPGVFTATTCKDFGTAWAKTRSSTSFGSEIKDFVTPAPAIISNCSPLEILKEDSGTTPAPLAGANFTITDNNNGNPAVPAGQGSCTTRSDGFCYVTVVPATDPPTFADPLAEPLLFPGSYHVVETKAPPGYLLPPHAADGTDVTVPQDKDANDVIIPLIFHDPLGSITVHKTGSGAALAGSTFTLTGPNSFSQTIFDGVSTVQNPNPNADGTADGTLSWTDLKTGTYTLHEDSAPTGYTTVANKTFVIQQSADDATHGPDLTATINDPVSPVLLTILKTDDSQPPVPLAGADFSLFQVGTGAGGTDTSEGSCTTSDGLAGHPPLGECSLSVAWGFDYYWVETKAPAGYNLPQPAKTPTFTVSASDVANGVLTPMADNRPTITTTATDAVIGNPITDSVTLTNLPTGAQGHVTFTVYGPFTTAADAVAANCTDSNPNNKATGATNPFDVNVTESNHTAHVSSGNFPTSALGFYAWKAVYSGDAAHGAAGVAGVCGDVSGGNDEVSQVTPEQPQIVTNASPATSVDGVLSDSATLSHFFGTPTGNVTFSLRKTCDGPVIGSVTLAINADGTSPTVSTAGHAPTTGTFNADNTTDSYFWSVTYTNDTNNKDVSEACGGTNETSHAPIIKNPTKTPEKGTVGVYAPDNTITYTITVKNTGLATATGVTVTDPIDVHATFNSSVSCTGFVSATCDFTQPVPDMTPTWTFDIAAGGTVTIVFTVTANPDDVDGQDIFNKATVHSGHVDIDTNVTDHTVIRPILALGKNANPLPVEDASAGGGTVSPGQTITYTLPLSNTGSAAANGVVATDQVPAHTSYDATNAAHCTVHDSSTPVACNAVEGGDPATVTWTVDVPANTTIDLVFSVVVDGQASLTDGQVIPNQGHFTWTYSDVSNGPNLSGDSRLIHHVVAFAILTLAKSSDPVSGSVVQRGDRIDYTVTLTNTGTAPADRTITDTLPANVTLIAGTDQPNFTTNNGSVVTWLVHVPAATVGEGGTVPGTVSVTYAVTVDKDAPEGATLTNVALVDGQCVGNADASACTTDHHVPTGALTLVKHVDKTTASYGDTLTYTFTAGTTGALDQSNVVVRDVLPKGTAYVAGSAGCTDAGPCTAGFSNTTKTVVWALGDMAAGTTRHLVFKVTIVTPSFDPTVGLPPETIVNSGTITSTETPSTPSNQVATKVVTVLGVKVVRPPKLPFTGVPAQTMLLAGLSLLGAGIILTSVRRRREH